MINQITLQNLTKVYLKNIEPHQRLREHEIIGEDINLDERI